MKLVLASSSVYRRRLLERLGVDFVCVTPQIDERPLEGEAPNAMVARLAEAKARRVAAGLSDALVIGSDQVAIMGGRPMGKPGGRGANIAQLEAASGHWVGFLTAICLLNSSSGNCQVDVTEYAVEFRALTRSQIENYVDRERPFDCAGGFKAEGLGAALFKRMRGDDPNSLIGLPLFRLQEMLEKEGVDVLSAAASSNSTSRADSS